MDRFRLLQICNRNAKAHCWVCPWAGDEPRDIFDEYIILFKQPLYLMAGTEFFVDIDFFKTQVAFAPVSNLQWTIFLPPTIDRISRPTKEDYDNYVCFEAPDLPWLFNSNFL